MELVIVLNTVDFFSIYRNIHIKFQRQTELTIINKSNKLLSEHPTMQ